jgi:hypothetical protein
MVMLSNKFPSMNGHPVWDYNVSHMKTDEDYVLVFMFFGTITLIIEQLNGVYRTFKLFLCFDIYST